MDRFRDSECDFDIAKLAYEGPARESDGSEIADTWNFSGPGGADFRIGIETYAQKNGDPDVRYARLFIANHTIQQPAGVVGLRLRRNFNLQVASAQFPNDFEIQGTCEERAIIVRDHLNAFFGTMEIKTLRGSLKSMIEILQAASNLSTTSINITCGEKRGELPGVVTDGDGTAGTAIKHIAEWFAPFGTAPAPLHKRAKRRSPARLETIVPNEDISGHDHMEQAVKLRAYLMDHIDELDLSDRVRSRVYKAFHLDTE